MLLTESGDKDDQKLKGCLIESLGRSEAENVIVVKSVHKVGGRNQSHLNESFVKRGRSYL